MEDRMPSLSFLRRLFQEGERQIVACMNESLLRLAYHIEALLPIKPLCSHALWQLDGQFVSRAKLMRYLKGGWLRWGKDSRNTSGRRRPR